MTMDKPNTQGQYVQYNEAIVWKTQKSYWYFEVAETGLKLDLIIHQDQMFLSYSSIKTGSVVSYFISILHKRAFMERTSPLLSPTNKEHSAEILCFHDYGNNISFSTEGGFTIQ